MVSRLLHRASLRFFQAHPAQLLLTITGILLGVALVTAVILTNVSARRAFELSASTVAGRATHQLSAAEGRIDDTWYTRFRLEYGFQMTPRIEGYASLGGELFTILGIDLFSAYAFQSTSALRDVDIAQTMLTTHQAVLINRRTRDRLSLPLNQPLEIDANGHRGTVTLVATIDNDSPGTGDNILICDIATAQRLLNRFGTIDRIDLILTDGQARQLRETLPSNRLLTDAASRARSMIEMTRGFQINLTAMSLLALLVGGFLIHNTMTFSILLRRENFATLRILGLTAAGLFRLILYEVLWIALVGSVLGTVFGFLLAHYLIRLTTRTINDLYFVLHVQQVAWSPGWLIGILLLGIVTSLLAAAASAAEAGFTSPLQMRQRSSAETRTLRWLLPLAGGGLLMIVSGAALAWIPSRSLLLGFGALMLLILGYGLMIPWLTRWLALTLHRWSPQRALMLNLALGGIHRHISRTGLAIAALTIAVASTLGVDIMIGSFRYTVDVWLGKTLQSDIYVTAPASVTTEVDGQLDPALVDALIRLPGVRSSSTSRSLRVRTPLGTHQMMVLTPHADHQGGFTFVEGDAETAWRAFTTEQSLLVSEPLATRYQLQRGDKIRLYTGRAGEQDFTIAGVYFDYGSSYGRMTIFRPLYQRYWRDRAISSVGLLLRSDARIEHVLEAIRQLLQQQSQKVLLRSNQEIRERSLTVFDQTFQVTQVLRLLTVAVAFIGVFSALLALQLEKARDYAVLRATGATSTQLAVQVILQCLLMGIIAGLFALPLGILMSSVLIQVINVRSFGWSMDSLIPDGALRATMLLAVASSVLAGIYPAWQLSRRSIASQLRNE